MRTIIIGDVHGCFKEFAELLEKCEIGSEDRLILLGDLMDRGPKSREVFEKVCEMKASMGDRFCLVRGNHEEMLLDAVLNQNESLWKSNGGMKTKSSFGPEKQKLIECADWIKVNMPYYQEFEREELIMQPTMFPIIILKIHPPHSRDFSRELGGWIFNKIKNAQKRVFF